MLDWDDEGQENHFSEDVERFEFQLSKNAVGFFDSDQLEGIIDHYIINGNYSKAQTASDIGIYHFPYNAFFYIRKAQSMSGLGQLKEALTVLAKAEEIESISLDLVITKATIFSQLRDSKTSIKYYKEALLLAENEDKDEIYLDLATELEALKDFTGAISVLEEAMRLNPKNEGALHEISYCLDQLGDLKKTVVIFNQFLDENPYSFTAWYNLGNTYSKLEQFDNAILAYEYCIAINETFAAAYFNKGNACLSSEKFKEAVESFEKCIELDGPDPLTYCYLGEAHEQSDELLTAWDYYKKSLEMAPELAEAWLGLGIIRDLQGDPKDSLKYIEKAIELEPQIDGYYHVYAGALENAGEIELAKINYLKCLTLEPENEDAFFDFVDFLYDNYTNETIDYITYFVDEHQFFFSILPLIYYYWINGKKQESILIYLEAMHKNKEKTKDLFIRYPELKNDIEFLNLSQD